ncbi:DNA primase [Bacillus sp. S2(2024)]|uniref:DNA primase n=1 Tax=Bacillus sp. S2(2024) TaxID=3162887 RepID=UPI003D1E94F4
MSVEKLASNRVLRPARSMSKGSNERWFEFYRTTCPICGKQGWCMVNDSETKIICGRIPSETKLGEAGYLHLIAENEKRGYDFSPDQMVKEHKKKNDYTLDIIYYMFLQHLEVRDEHIEMLTGPNRKIPKEAITIRNYKSFPVKPWEVTRELIKRAGGKTGLIVGIPGFYAKETENGRYFTFSGRRDSLLIPQRNIYNQICGFQYRIDKPKFVTIVRNNKTGFKAEVIEQPNIIEVSSYINGKKETIYEGKVDVKKWYEINYQGDRVGEVQLKLESKYVWVSSSGKFHGTGVGNPLPIHVAVPTRELQTWERGKLLQKENIWITEGSLKSDISADNLDELLTEEEKLMYGTTVVSIPGVKVWRILVGPLKEMGVKQATFALDMDMIANPDVQKTLLECAQALYQDGISINYASWDINLGKGLDDLLLQDYIPKIDRVK